MRKALSMLLTLAMTTTLMAPTSYALADDAVDRAVLYGLEEDEPYTDDATDPMPGDRLLGDNGYEDEPAVPAPSNTSNTRTFSIAPEDDYNNSYDSYLGAQDDTDPAPSSDPVGTGTIKVDSGWVSPNSYRDAWQYTGWGNASWMGLPYWGSGAAELIDANGNVVGSVSGASRIAFENLPAGTYTIRLPQVYGDNSPYVIVKGVVNGGAIPHLLTEPETEVVLEDGKTLTYWVAYEYKAYGFKTTTDIGTFKNGTRENVYYEGWNKSFPIPDTSGENSEGVYVNQHNGIYRGDSASLYAGMSELEVPTLSDEEAAKGYLFQGWQLVEGGRDTDDPNKIYTTKDALGYKLSNHVTFKAVWETPVHNVTFSTNTEYGTIEGKAKYSYTQEFDNDPVKTFPKVTPQEGYEFIGWFNDLTTNVIPDEELKSTLVNKDLNFYAKFRKVGNAGGTQNPNLKYTVKYVGGTDGDLKGTDSMMVPAGGKIPTIPSVRAHDHATFIKEWQVISVSDGADHIKEGDILTEDQIARLEVNFDIIFEALYYRNYYTVTYLDGANNTAFMPVVTESLEHGSDTPQFEGTPTRDGHEFIGWDSHIHDTVTEDRVYTAQWKKIGDESGSGTNGKDGTNGTNGTNGKDGVNGTNGTGSTTYHYTTTYSGDGSKSALAKTGDVTSGTASLFSMGLVALMGGWLLSSGRKREQ